MIEAFRKTLADTLPPDMAGLGRALLQAVRTPGLPRSSALLHDQLRTGLASALEQVDLGQLLGSAFVTARSLHAHRHDDPSLETNVPLDDLSVELEVKPTLAIWIGAQRCGSLELDYKLTLAFAAVDLGLRGGRLVAAGPGPCRMTASLACGGVDLHPPWTLAAFQLQPVLHFMPGLPIP